MRFKYEDLEIWQLTLELVKAIYDILKKFPGYEKYDLVSQGKRAVVSVALNIAEGSGEHTNKDFSAFINRSMTSLQEVDAVLKIGIKLGYITPEDCSSVNSLIEKEYFKLIAFDKALTKALASRKRYSEGRRLDTAVIMKMQGDIACAYGALYGGCNFFAGYPITPASEVEEQIALEIPKVGGFHIQMEDEMASMGAVIGAVWARARGMTATLGPGFSLMQENIGYAIMTETPCVIVDIQRSGPSTGQATKPAQGDMMQARWGTHGDHEIITLSPSSVQECLDLTIKYFNLAEEYRNPVILLMDGELGHMREKLVMPDPDKIKLTPRKFAKPGELIFGGELIPPMVEFGTGAFVHVTGSTHKETGMRDVQTHAVHELGLEPKDIVCVTGIGCSSWIPSPYYKADTLHVTHGRPIAFATGVKIMKPNMKVVVIAAGASYVARWTTYHVLNLLKSMKEAIAKKDFSFIEIVSQCPVSYGKMVGMRSASDFLRLYKESSVPIKKAEKMSVEELKEKIVIGKFVDRERQEFTESLRKINEKRMKKVKSMG